MHKFKALKGLKKPFPGDEISPIPGRNLSKNSLEKDEIPAGFPKKW